MEDIAVYRVRDTHELRSNRPRKGRPFVLFEKLVRAESDDVFRVDEKSVHVENAGPHCRETAGGLLAEFIFLLYPIITKYT